MAISKKEERRLIDKIFVLLGVVVMAVLLTAGIIAWEGYRYATAEVKDQLSSQKIYFPAKGSPGFSPAEFPTLQKYAGQAVDNGPKAKAYADDFMAIHIQKIAGGKTYSEISNLAMANPDDQQLQALKATLFQGETLRGLLLGDGYAYWTMGILARDAAIAFFVGAGFMLILIMLGLNRVRRYR